MDATLAWASEAIASIAESDGTAPPAGLETWAMDADAELSELLAARGWIPADEPHFSHYYRRLDTPIEDVPALPDGYRLRHVRLPEDAAADAFLERLRFEFDTSVVPGRFFEMPDHFRIGMGVNTEMFVEGFNRMGQALGRGD